MGVSNTTEQPQLVIHSETWAKESHGLYDFDCQETTKEYFSLQGTHTVSRTDNQLSLQSKSTFQNDKNDAVIARLLYRQGQYWIYHKAIIDETHDTILE